MNIKNVLRSTLIFFHIDITKNIEYDRLTAKIIKDNLNTNSNCIDVGSHKGEILELMLKYAPNGKHYAFETIPYLFTELQKKYANNAEVFSCALSDNEGESSFQLVKNAPAYSGIKKRRYDISNPDIEEINIEKRKLDKIISPEKKIDLIKIDVEGGEFDVLKGARQLLKRDKPIIVFECGKGASDFYGTDPKDLFYFLKKEIGLNIYTLKSFIDKKEPLKINEFSEYFDNNMEYYFVAN
jgi:FkbM family methyltransferase